MNQALHPSWLQAISLLWIRVLEGLRSLLTIPVLSVDRDPTVMLTEQTVCVLGRW